MKAVILAGGFGTRLSEETESIPKPMIEIGGRPLLWHLMKIFSHQGVNDFSIALGYKGDVIKRYFLQYPQLHSDLAIDLGRGTVDLDERFEEHWRLELVDTGADTMTGGRLRRLRERLDDTFFFTYGDGLSDIDLDGLLAFHKAHGRLATVTAVRPRARFGVLHIDADDRVQRFNEKPDDQSDYVNGGFFVLEPGAIDYIDGDSTTWERDPCERLALDGQLLAYRHDGYWQCVDTLHELRLLRDAWNRGEAGWKVW
ncbi:MAG: glucose-1-phosphate cytidylyltransferase [Gammaproteobacteria bacterium]|nr:glucose-1-phosphate cytidylyltransferase [Gammaproteobacteria bacterium]